MRFTSRTLSFFVLLLAVLAGCGAAGSNSSPSSASGTNSGPGLHISLDVDRFEFDSPSVMCTAVFVSEVTVQAKGQGYWNTSDGKLPANATSTTVTQNGYAIYTPVAFTQMKHLVDHRHQQQNKFVLMGGQQGPNTYQIGDFPQIDVDKTYLVVFGLGHDPQTHKNVEDTLTVYNAFLIDKQGLVHLKERAVEQGQVSQEPLYVPVTSVEQQLQACK